MYKTRASRLLLGRHQPSLAVGNSKRLCLQKPSGFLGTEKEKNLGKMKFELLTSKYADQAAQVLIDAFGSDAYNWGRALNRPHEFFEGYTKFIYIPSIVASTVPSLVALDDDDAKTVVGLLTLEEFDDLDPPDPARVAITAILNAGHDIFWDELLARKGEHRENVGPVCYFGFLAVSADHRRRHIGEALVRECRVLAKAAGYRVAVAFCTSPKSTTLFQKVGFERWGEVKYATFQLEIDRSFPFKSLPDEMTIMVSYL